MTQTIDLNVSKRSQGKHVARVARVTGQIPAIVYGPKLENTVINIDERDVLKFFNRQNENAIFKFKSDDKKLNGVQVFIKKIDRHPVSRKHVHVDLYAADMSKEIRVHVMIKFTGIASGTKTGGIFTEILRVVEVECLPTNIPQSLSLDISNLEINDSLKAADLVPPAGVKIITRPEETICAVTHASEEIVATPAEGATEGILAEGATPAEGAAAPAAGATPAKGAAPAAKADEKGGKKDEKK